MNILFKIKSAIVGLLISVGIISSPAPAISTVTAPSIVKDQRHTTTAKHTSLPSVSVVKKVLSPTTSTTATNVQSQPSTVAPISIPVTPQPLLVPSPAPVALPQPVVITQPVIVQVQPQSQPPTDNPLNDQTPAPNTTIYDIVPQAGSPLKSRQGLDLEGLRAYIMGLNNSIGFQVRIQNATADELVAYLQDNGFQVVQR